MKGTLYAQYGADGNRIDKPVGCVADIYVDRNGYAQAYTTGEGKLITEMCHVKIEWIATKGIKLSGVDDVHGDRRRMHYQEWWIEV